MVKAGWLVGAESNLIIGKPLTAFVQVLRRTPRDL